MDLSHQLPNFIFAQTSVVMAIWRRLETCEVLIVHEGMPHSCILESEVLLLEGCTEIAGLRNRPKNYGNIINESAKNRNTSSLRKKE